ncbi:hypothetical protein KFK09_022864 [Dendrobium nobile]|uniref:Uncharacterized protein n=1 Tax=Dendrobium nobile TaxID=94219 RepID=A0A8T3AKH6_DENNO|nr:hypothetical protein KFK09_022864 [Dendrobium nobile]
MFKQSRSRMRGAARGVEVEVPSGGNGEGRRDPCGEERAMPLAKGSGRPRNGG